MKTDLGTLIWRTSITGLIGIIIAIGGYFASWGFERIEAMPSVYETKANAEKKYDRLEEQQQVIIDKIDKGFQRVNDKLFQLAGDGETG